MKDVTRQQVWFSVKFWFSVNMHTLSISRTQYQTVLTARDKEWVRTVQHWILICPFWFCKTFWKREVRHKLTVTLDCTTKKWSKDFL